MSEQPYRSIDDLLKALGEKADKLREGQLPANELAGMLDDARELSDRLVVLRYKAFEDAVKGPAEDTEKRKNEMREPEADAPKKEKSEKKQDKKKPSSFQLNFHNQAEMTAEEEIIPRNQVNLIDAIEQEEKGQPEEELAKEAPEEAVTDETPVEESPVAEVAPEPEPEAGEVSESLNDRMRAETEEPTLAKKLQKRPIKDLKTAIGINQKFLFMNELFEGENQLYYDALDYLNGLTDFNEAEGYLTELSDRYTWDWSSKQVKHFVSLVERRYQ